MALWESVDYLFLKGTCGMLKAKFRSSLTINISQVRFGKPATLVNFGRHKKKLISTD